MHSLTLLAEVLRGVLLATVAMLSWITLRRIHRGKTGGYDFGLGKMEQVLSLFVALLLCARSVFIWYKALMAAGDGGGHITGASQLPGGRPGIRQLHRQRAAPALLYKAVKAGNSVLVVAQFRTKIADTIASFVVTVCVA